MHRLQWHNVSDERGVCCFGDDVPHVHYFCRAVLQSQRRNRRRVAKTGQETEKGMLWWY